MLSISETVSSYVAEQRHLLELESSYELAEQAEIASSDIELTALERAGVCYYPLLNMPRTVLRPISCPLYEVDSIIPSIYQLSLGINTRYPYVREKLVARNNSSLRRFCVVCPERAYIS